MTALLAASAHHLRDYLRGAATVFDLSGSSACRETWPESADAQAMDRDSRALASDWAIVVAVHAPHRE